VLYGCSKIPAYAGMTGMGAGMTGVGRNAFHNITPVNTGVLKGVGNRHACS